MDAAVAAREGVPPMPPSICFAACDLIESDLSAHFRQTALLLARHGWRVHVLHCHPDFVDRKWLSRVRHLFVDEGVSFSTLDNHPLPAWLRTEVQHGVNKFLSASEHVRRALEELHAATPFDLIEFADRGGAGFRSIQARRVGTAFADVRLLVRLHGPGQLERERNHRWLTDLEDLRTDYAERYAFENSVAQFAPSPGLVDAVRAIGWRVRPELRLIGADEGEIVESYRALLALPAERPSAARSEPLVSVVVSHYNLGDYLPETLASLAAQDHPDLDVIVVDDGSTCERSRRVLKEQQRRYPHFRWIEQANAGCGAARNRGLAEARGEYIVLMDADNVARPHMISTMVHGMQRNPELTALTCYMLAFRTTDDLRNDHYEFLTSFAGGPFVLACTENVYGDTNAIFRTEALRTAGGIVNDRATPWEDWITYVKLASAGHQIDVIPECLFYYRERGEGRHLAMNRGEDDRYLLLQHLLRTAFVGAAIPCSLDAAQLWTALLSYKAKMEQPKPLLYRAADRLYHGLKKVPFLHRGLKSVYNLLSSMRRRTA
jgi:glycosyltransferase involved in cell wall biosynthesis